MNVRPYRSTDLEAVVAVYTAAVHGLGAEHYDARQREAWAPRSPDLGVWAERLGRVHTLVAEDAAEIAGFVAYEDDGHVDLLFVAPEHARRGVAGRLYARVEAALHAAGVEELFTEASLVARPFFERQGFRVTEVQEVEVRGVLLRRFAMRKPGPPRAR